MDAFTYGLKPVPFRIFLLGRSFFGDPFQRFGTERSFEGLRPSFSATYPDFLHGAPPTLACAAFIKESRMKSANASKIHRKSGVRWGRTLSTVQGTRLA